MWRVVSELQDGWQDGSVSKAFVSLASPFGLAQRMSSHEWSSSIVQWIEKDGEVPYKTPCTCCTEKGAGASIKPQKLKRSIPCAHLPKIS